MSTHLDGSFDCVFIFHDFCKDKYDVFVWGNEVWNLYTSLINEAKVTPQWTRLHTLL